MDASELVVALVERLSLPQVLTCTVTLPNSYSKTRQCWNGLINKYPVAIVQVESATDISQTITLCQQFRHQMTIRGGGHNVAGCCIEDGAVMLDLARMNKVTFDSSTNIFKAQGGSIWESIDKVGSKYGKSVPCGLISHTGVGGLTLGGGIGWLSRSNGLSCDSLIAADIITSKGEYLKISAESEEHADLFWAIRGGGGNFGVVENFYFKATSIPSRCQIGQWQYPLLSVSTILPLYASLCSLIPNTITLYLFVSPHHISILGVDVAFDSVPLSVSCEPLFSTPSILHSNIEELPLAEINKKFDFGNRPGREYYWSRSTYFSHADQKKDTDFGESFNVVFTTCFKPLLDFIASDCPALAVNIELVQMGGKISELPFESTAFAHRDAQFEVHCIFSRRHESDLPADILAQSIQAASFYSNTVKKLGNLPCNIGGGYMNTDNFMVPSKGCKASHVYGIHYEKLRALKLKYDPQCFFNKHHPIEPENSSQVVQYSSVPLDRLLPSPRWCLLI